MFEVGLADLSPTLDHIAAKLGISTIGLIFLGLWLRTKHQEHVETVDFTKTIKQWLVNHEESHRAIERRLDGCEDSIQVVALIERATENLEKTTKQLIEIQNKQSHAIGKLNGTIEAILNREKGL